MSDTKLDDENFATELTDKTKNHKQWLGVVRFGLPTLLDNQPLLMEIIVREAQRMCEETVCAGRVPADYARCILDELGLKLVSADG